MKKKQRDSEGLSLSFLDCICCGFGAVILLLIMTKANEPQLREKARVELGQRIESLREQVEQMREEAGNAALEEQTALERAAAEEARDADLRAELERLRQTIALVQKDSSPSQMQTELAVAKQKLSEEMKRLHGARGARPRADAPIGGIPVDSEYVIFVIDTSGSMVKFAWPLVLEKVQEALDVYPRVKGIQVLNDEGGYMFEQFKGQWIPDDPGRRKAIVDTLRTWRPFSNSSPVEGIDTAIRTFYRPDRDISIYVFGDDFSGNALLPVVKAVDRLNRESESGERRVRIHAVGFPVQYLPDQVTQSGYRFAQLMRVLCERNGGAFVGLPKLRAKTEDRSAAPDGGRERSAR
jgi:hypothetical protein